MEDEEGLESLEPKPAAVEPGSLFAPRGRRPDFTAEIFVILGFAAFYFAREFFMPVVLALLFALLLAPPVHALGRRKIPAPAGAG